MPQQQPPLFELEGDLPIRPPTKSFARTKAVPPRTESSDSLKPAPLNFSRPAAAFNFSRPRQRPSDNANVRDNESEPLASPAEYTAGPRFPIHQPYIGRSVTNETLPAAVNEEEEEQEEDDVDSFIGRTEDNQESSGDDAAPPPVVRTSTLGSGSVSGSDSVGGSSRELSSFYTANSHRPISNSSQGGATWIYKPYAESFNSSNLNFNSDASSIFTATTTSEDFTDPGDASSIAESAITSHSSISDFAFDGRMGWNPRANQPSQAEQERQRWVQPQPQSQIPAPLQVPGPGPQRATSRGANAPIPVTTEPPSSSNSNHSSSTLSARSTTDLQPSTTHQRSNSATSGASATSNTSSIPSQRGPQTTRPPRITDNIVKRTSFDQQSIHIAPQRSNSSASTSGSVSSTEWQGSDFDTSGLSPEKIAKLKKKGINPALYAEMKQARKGQGKGKRWVSPLTGNTFLS
ncbi:hypothetical protein MBLNU457_3835t1 [Dothideomycetes sp. NU457]